MSGGTLINYNNLRSSRNKMSRPQRPPSKGTLYSCSNSASKSTFPPGQRTLTDCTTTRPKMRPTGSRLSTSRIHAKYSETIINQTL